MKCPNCGFTYENEPVCPICGAPSENAAPVVPSAPEASYYAPHFQPPAAVPVPQPITADTAPASAKPEKSESPQKSKGLMIAALCVLSVIAAALVYHSIISTLTYIRGRDRDKLYTKASKLMESIPYDSLDPYGDDEELLYDDAEDYTELQDIIDDVIHKPGEAFDFGYGTLCLKSVTKAYDGDAANQYAFTIEITNNTDSTQEYNSPYIYFDDERFDAENYLYTSDENFESTLAPGKSTSSVVYYSVPKSLTKLNCYVSTDDLYDTYYAETHYELEFK